MPRPGTRPYECVRRAWHSDRHQSIRGSLIQEIFRLAIEAHGVGTRKNKEWQEKLPFVVLKAEEIIYSKANSEAEYMDFTTLWERVNDAIDTIIRKDESTETEVLLKPCIEAALNLGCIPRRASRSQRHNNPRCYLSSGTPEPVDTSTISPVVLPYGKSRLQYQGILRPPLPVAHTGDTQNSTEKSVDWYSSSGNPVSVSCSRLGGRSFAPSQEHRGSVSTPRYEFPQPSVESSDKDRHLSSLSESFTRSITGRVYPLHYFENHQGIRQQFPFNSSSHSKCTSLGRSRCSGLPTTGEIVYPTLDSVPISCRERPLPSMETSTSNQDRDPCSLFDFCTWPSTGRVNPLHCHEHLPDNSTRSPIHTSVGSNCNAFAAGVPSRLHTRKGDTSSHNSLAAGNVGCPMMEISNPGNLECDLSLRLGPPSIPYFGVEKGWIPEVEDAGSSSVHDGNKFDWLDSSPSVNGAQCVNQ